LLSPGPAVIVSVLPLTLAVEACAAGTTNSRSKPATSAVERGMRDI
jgi:hypothetical protein